MKNKHSSSAPHGRTYRVNESFFARVDSEARAYVLGFTAADGNVSGKCFRYGLKASDRGQLEAVRRLLGSDHPIRDRLMDDGAGGLHPACELQVNSTRMVKDLAALGVGPAKSFTLRPWCGPARLLRHYWRGVVDGDGSVRRNGPGYLFALSGNLAMVEGFIRFVAEETGITGRPEPDKSIFCVRFGRFVQIQAVAGLLYRRARYALERKRRVALEIMAGRRLTKDWSGVTADRLREMRARLGGWLAVGAALGVPSPMNVHALRKRLGVAL